MRDHWLPRIITCDWDLDLHLGPHGETGAARPPPLNANARGCLLPAGLRLP
jgi:hypothetical protein